MMHDWTEENIQGAIEKAETISIDLKKGNDFVGDYAAKLTVTIASMANTRNGGIILVGVENDKTTSDCTPYLSSWDKTKVVNVLKSRLDPIPEIEIIQKQYKGVTVIIVEILEFSETPIILKESIQINGKQYQAGSLFIRTIGAESKVISTADEMRNFLRIAVAKKTEQITRDIEEILNGPKAPNPIPIQEKFKISLPDWETSVSDKKFDSASIETRIIPLNSRNKQSSFDEICRHIVYDNPSIIDHSFPYYYNAQKNLRKKNTYVENFVEYGEIPYQFWQIHYDGTCGVISTLWSETAKEEDTYWHTHISLRGICDLIFESYILARNIARLYDVDFVTINLKLSNIENKFLGDKPAYRMRSNQSFVKEVTFDKQYSLAEIVNLEKHVQEAIDAILNAFNEFKFSYVPVMKGWQN